MFLPIELQATHSNMNNLQRRHQNEAERDAGRLQEEQIGNKRILELTSSAGGRGSQSTAAGQA